LTLPVLAGVGLLWAGRRLIDRRRRMSDGIDVRLALVSSPAFRPGSGTARCFRRIFS